MRIHAEDLEDGETRKCRRHVVEECHIQGGKIMGFFWPCTI